MFLVLLVPWWLKIIVLSLHFECHLKAGLHWSFDFLTLGLTQAFFILQGSPMPSAKADLMMYAASEYDSNLYYAVKFVVPDPFPFFQIKGKKIILMSDLELGRSKKQAQVDEIVSYSDIQVRAKKSGIEKPGVADVTAFFLKSRKVQKIKCRIILT